MSIEALDWAFKLDHPDMTSTMKLVLLVLADFSNNYDESYPRQATIANRTKLTQRAIINNINKLVEIGAIKKERQQRSDGSNGSSLYKLIIPDESKRNRDPRDTGEVNAVHRPDLNVVQVHTNEVQGHTNVVHMKGERGSEGHVNEVQNINLPYNKPPKKPSIKNRKTSAWPADYRDQFWNLYPKKPGMARQNAIAKLERIEKSDKVEFSELMTGLKHYAQRMKNKINESASNVEFITAAVVWLNQARWETEQPVENRPSRDTWKGTNLRKVTAI
jgi:hypothetical protein